MGIERLTLTLIIILCVLTGVQDFSHAAIAPSLVEVPFSIQVTYNGTVLDVIDSALPPGGNNVTLGSANWTGDIVFQASFTGSSSVQIQTTIGGIAQEVSASFAWTGSGYAGSMTTSNGYTIEAADQTYFASTTPPAPTGDPTAIGTLVGFGIGVLLWQVFARSMRERSVMW